MKITKKYAVVALTCAVWSMKAFATDGYFAMGYGTKSLGMGGVGIALPQDGLAAAYNPAGIGLIDDQINLGLTFFRPYRNSEVTGNSTPGFNGHYNGDSRRNFYIPEAGFVKRLSDTTSVGLAAYGSGGLNADYANNPFKAFGSKGNLEIDLAQMFLKPSIAYKLNEKHTFGVGVNVILQRLAVDGLQGFSAFSIDPSRMTNNGHDTAFGLGLHLGWIGQLTDTLSLGATWSSRGYSTKFHEYSGLLTDRGNFDVPMTYGIGIAFKGIPALTLAADLQRINYSGIASIANPVSNLLAGNLLGSRNGPGFNWRNITVVKVGASYDVNPNLALRVGYNHSGQPIPSDQTFLNIIAPAVIQDHVSFGGTWKTASNGEWNAYYAHAFKKQVRGVNSIPQQLGGGNANLDIMENQFGVSYTWKL